MNQTASVVAENVVALEIARAVREKFGGDSISEVRSQFASLFSHGVYLVGAWLGAAVGKAVGLVGWCEGALLGCNVGANVGA